MSKKPVKMVIAYSGSMMGPSQPERALWILYKKKPTVMLTYWEIFSCKKMNETLRRIKRLKRQRKEEKTK